MFEKVYRDYSTYHYKLICLGKNSFRLGLYNLKLKKSKILPTTSNLRTYSYRGVKKYVLYNWVPDKF